MGSSGWVRVGRLGAASAVLVLAAACSSSGSGTAPAAPTSSSAPATSSAPASSASGADLAVAKTALGQVVVDRQGRTAYYFDKDKAGSGASTCSGDCLTAWPAVVASSATPTVEGVTGKVGTITRDDGTLQVTVEGRPVYLFVKDTAAGDVKGQGVGGVWYVIAADGSEVRASAAG